MHMVRGFTHGYYIFYLAESPDQRLDFTFFVLFGLDGAAIAIIHRASASNITNLKASEKLSNLFTNPLMLCVNVILNFVWPLVMLFNAEIEFCTSKHVEMLFGGILILNVMYLILYTITFICLYSRWGNNAFLVILIHDGTAEDLTLFKSELKKMSHLSNQVQLGTNGHTYLTYACSRKSELAHEFVRAIINKNDRSVKQIFKKD